MTLHIFNIIFTLKSKKKKLIIYFCNFALTKEKAMNNALLDTKNMISHFL